MTITKKIVLGGVATILLGAIGSGVWEYMLKPISSFSSEFVLNFISFGINNFKDKIYLEIAKNLHEGVGMSILILVTSVLSGFILAYLILFLARKFIRSYIEKTIVQENKDKKMFFYKIFISFYMIFAASFFLEDVIRTGYINKSITKYNQLLIITRPYMGEGDAYKINSSFALIKNKLDYDLIIKNLIQIAEENKLNIKNIE